MLRVQGAHSHTVLRASNQGSYRLGGHPFVFHGTNRVPPAGRGHTVIDDRNFRRFFSSFPLFLRIVAFTRRFAKHISQ